MQAYYLYVALRDRIDYCCRFLHVKKSVIYPAQADEAKTIDRIFHDLGRVILRDAEADRPDEEPFRALRARLDSQGRLRLEVAIEECFEFLKVRRVS